jgi:hypothetical protein
VVLFDYTEGGGVLGGGITSKIEYERDCNSTKAENGVCRGNLKAL